MVKAAPKHDPHAFVLLAEILGEMGEPGAKTVRSAMTRSLPSVRNPELFSRLVRQLQMTGPEGVNLAVSAVVQALKGTEVALFEAAAGHVKGLGNACVKQAGPVLRKAAQRKDARIAKAAVDTLIKLGKIPPEQESGGGDLDDLLDDL